MKTYRTSFLSVAAFLMLLCSVSIFSRTARACPDGVSGPTSFTAAPGGSQTLTWTAYSIIGGGSIMSVEITAGSDVFTLSQMPFSYTDSGTFTVTFTPGANATGTFRGSIICGCKGTHELVGTVAAAGVPNALPINVSFTISPNPATDNISIMSSGVRTAEIGIYDLLGKEIASSKTTTWKWDASGVATGSYIVRIVGESDSGEEFVVWRRIIIAR